VAEPQDPLMLHDPNTKLTLETPIEADGEEAFLRAVDLPDLGQAGNRAHGIIPQNSGFYILRNNREIMEAITFDFYKKHPDFSHFRAKISFDGSLDSVFHTDVKEMTISPPQSFMDKLRQATQVLRTISGLRVQFDEGNYSTEIPFYHIKQEGWTIFVTYDRAHLSGGNYLNMRLAQK